MLYSFDIFDTLITRTTATPKGIFAIMQERLISDETYRDISEYVRYNFFSLRIYAEELSIFFCRRNGDEDTSIKQIYETIGRTGNLSLAEAEQLICLEKEIEYDHVVGVTANIAKVRGLLQQGQCVVLISDMYLEAGTIRRLLMKADPLFAEIKIYVSSEYKKGKGSGNLFRIVKQCENVEYSDWIHCGDNLASDIEAARKLGIRTEYCPSAALMDCEVNALKHGEMNSFVQLTLGTAKNARWMHSLTGTAAFGCSVGGAVLFPYVWWVLQQSIANKIKRLYFIARDGYVLKRIADIIIEKLGYDIETHYIYGSRKAWRISSFSESNDDTHQFVEAYDSIKDVGDLANVFQIPVADFKRFLSYPYDKADTVLTPQVVAALGKRLNDSAAFKQYLWDRHKDKRALTIAYLKQEIDTSDHAFAFVELFGSGLTQECLGAMIQDFYDGINTTFFAHVFWSKDTGKQRYWSFFPNKIEDFGFFIELLCRAPHGQTAGYRMSENGRIVPEIQETEGDILVNQGFDQYMRGVEAFAGRYADLIEKTAMKVDNLTLFLYFMEYIAKTPDEEMLSFLGDMPYSVSGRDHSIVRFAPRLSCRELRSLFLLRTREPIRTYYQGASLKYSLMRCTEGERKQIEFYQAHHDSWQGRLARWWRQINGNDPAYPYLAYGFPCEALAGRVVLYAAGKMGCELYQKIKRSKTSKVVQWVDQNFEKYREQGLPVSHPDTIGQIEYDQIAIAVLDSDLADVIRSSLTRKGVAREKLIWLDGICESVCKE